MRELGITADDYGLHPDINRGIADCVSARAVTGVSFCANGRAVEWDVLRDWQAHGVRLGLHLTLVGESWLTDRRVLADWRVMSREIVMGGPLFRRAVKLEIAAQWDQAVSRGIEPRVLDSHQHIHLLPGIWESVEALARTAPVQQIRIPRATGWGSWRKGLPGWCLEGMSRWRAGSDLAGPPCFGLRSGGQGTCERWIQELSCFSGPAVELVAHPGWNTPDLMSRYGEWNYDWNGEREALLNPRWRSFWEGSGWRLAAGGA